MDKFEENTNIFFEEYVSDSKFSLSSDYIPWNKEIERKLFFERISKAKKIFINDVLHLNVDNEIYHLFCDYASYSLYMKDNMMYMKNLNEYES